VVPQDATLWQLIAYCAGTGGSILIIGSAAGVAFMGMEKADFVWYLRKVSPFALAGYLAGAGTYVGMHALAAAPAVAAVLDAGAL
jgi:Na+/H+ antiporter NhaD/arsenite permease-like protein